MGDTEQLILQALPRIDIEFFEDCQFHHEPHMRLLQRSHHDLRDQIRCWSAIGKGKRSNDENKGPSLSRILSNAKLPRATAHPHHEHQIKSALTMAQNLLGVIKALGTMHAQEDVPAEQEDLFDGLLNDALHANLGLSENSVWLITAYNPIKDAHNPINRIGMVQCGDGAVRPCLFWCLPIPTPQAGRRLREVADLTHWALRQPRLITQAQ